MSKARQLVEAVLAEGTAKDFLRSVAPTVFSWLRPYGLELTNNEQGRAVFTKTVDESESDAYIVRVIVSDERSPAAQVAATLNGVPTLTGSGVIEVCVVLVKHGDIIFSITKDYYAHPERVPYALLQEMLGHLLKRLVSYTLQEQSLTGAIRLAFEDTDLGYYQALADAAHAHDEDEPEDEP